MTPLTTPHAEAADRGAIVCLANYYTLIATAIRARLDATGLAWRRMSELERTLWLNRKAASAVTLLLVPAVALVTIRLAHSFADEETVHWTPPSSPYDAARVPGASDYKAIWSSHLFGTPAPRVNAPADVIEAPLTTLSFSLHGVVASTDARFSHALIADGSGREGIYFLESDISQGIKLAAIYTDRVILNHAGQYETLRLPEYGDSRRTADRLAGAPTATDPEELSGGGHPEQTAPSPPRLADIMTSRPHVTGGRFSGLEVYPGERGEDFSRLGLKPGDIITEIDGRKLTASDPTAPFQSLAAETSLTFTIDRRGQTLKLRIDDDRPANMEINRVMQN
ncbi:MAG: hypothetical protein IT485_08155 [Gammaproteobacteria bacterium]|nr:hypothetical protein [Gammaproteobacteria bacterium]QOJ32165.1 MAG: hypothetical protein HRU81_08675 [Gammaproteobacteria bacterium]